MNTPLYKPTVLHVHGSLGNSVLEMAQYFIVCNVFVFDSNLCRASQESKYSARAGANECNSEAIPWVRTEQDVEIRCAGAHILGRESR